MTSINFILELKRRLSEDSWHWVTAALHQDPLIWDQLNKTELGARALDLLPCQPENWSPVALCLLALDNPISLADLIALPMQPLPTALRSQAVFAFEKWPAYTPTTPFNLAQAGLFALAIRERRRITGAWEGLLTDIGNNLWLRQVVVCLYGMIPDPLDLLLSIIHQADGDQNDSLALHVFLCNPIAPLKQGDLLDTLINRLDIIQSHHLLHLLETQRPSTSINLARRLLSRQQTSVERGHNSPDNPPSAHLISDEIIENLHNLDTLLKNAESLHLAAQSTQEIQALADALKSARQLQAHIAADLGKAASQTSDHKTALEAWKQATQLAPDSEEYAARLALALKETGRLKDALAYLAAKNADATHPAILLASATISNQLGEIKPARQAALQALQNIQGAVAGNPEDFILPLTRILLELDLPDEAIQSVNLALSQFPNHPELLELAARAKLLIDQPDDALPIVYLALAQSSGQPGLKQLLIECLESAGEWYTALEERSAFLERSTPAKPEEYLAFAGCAIQAKQPQKALLACQKALELNPKDGRAYFLLGQFAQAQGDFQQALEHFQQANQLAPYLDEIWMGLAKTYKSLNQKAKALETLRTASQACPNSAEIHLALGEAYLTDDLPTQALLHLRQAFSLIPSYTATSLGKPQHLTHAESSLFTRIQLLLGRTLHQLGHLDEARDVFEKAYQEMPIQKPDPHIAYAYAKTLLAFNLPAEALAPLEVVVNNNPDEVEPYLDYARTLLKVGKDQNEYARKAIHILEIVLGKKPDHPEGRALLAEAYAACGEKKKAYEAYHLALDTQLSIDPSWRGRLSLGLGQVALELGKYEAAIAALHEADLVDHQNPLVQRGLSEAYLALGLLSEAFQAACNTRQLDADNLDNLTWFADQMLSISKKPGGEALRVEHEATQAIFYASQLAPTRADLLLRLGMMQMENGDQSSALDTFGKLASMPDVPYGDLFQAAIRLRQLGDFQRAATLLEQALVSIRKDPSAAETMHTVPVVELYTVLSTTYRAMGNHGAAINTLDQAIGLKPENSTLYLIKADLLVEAGKPQVARDCLESALGVFPAEASLHLKLARTLRKLGNLVLAINHAEQAISLSSSQTQEADRATLNIASRCLLADMTRSMLQDVKALSILSDRWPVVGKINQADQFEYACLRAELAFRTRETEKAAQAIDVVTKLDANHPRTLAARARLTIQLGETSSGVKILEAALQKIVELQSASPQGYQPDLALLRTLGEAAMEANDWDEAIQQFNQACEIAPSEPLSHLQIAQALVLRAEAQSLCEALDVIQHAPGPVALDEATYQKFESAIQAALELITAWHQSHEALKGNQQNDPEGFQTLYYWRSRGRATFKPTPENTRSLEQALETQSATPDEVAALVTALGRIKDYDTAIKVAMAFPQHPRVLRQLALALDEENPRQALGAARNALEYLDAQPNQQPQDKPLYQVLLARLAYRTGVRNGDRETALQAIHAALFTWPEESRWHALAAKIYMSKTNGTPTSDAQSAINHLEHAIQIEPNLATNYIDLGNIFLKTDESERANQLLEQAIRIAPEQPEAWLALTQAQFNRGDFERAAISADRCIELAQNLIPALIIRGEIDMQTNNPQKAEERARLVLEINPEDSAGLHLLARALNELNRPDEALRTLEKGISTSKNRLPLQLERVRLLKQTKGPEAALEALGNLAESHPDEPTVLAPLAEALVEAGKSEAAIQSARLALQSDKGKLAHEEQAYLHYLVGRQLHKAGQLDQAVFHLSESIKHGASNLDTYLELGRAHHDRRQYAQAINVFKKAIHLAPNDYHPYYFAGLSLKESKDYLGAEDMLRQAAELAPDEVSIHRLLGALVALNLVHNRNQSPVK